MSIVFEEVVGNVEAPAPGPIPEEAGATPSQQPSREPERDRVRAALCRERRRAARLAAD